MGRKDNLNFFYASGAMLVSLFRAKGLLVNGVNCKMSKNAYKWGLLI